MLRKLFYMAAASGLLVSCASNYEAEKAITRAEMNSGSQQSGQAREEIAQQLRPVYFETGSAKITPRFEQRLSQNVKVLKNNPEYKIYVSGHADSRGEESRNWELAMKRAKAVEDFLVKEGISRDRIYTISKGENDPRVSANDESYYQINRRVELQPFTTEGALAE